MVLFYSSKFHVWSNSKSSFCFTRCLSESLDLFFVFSGYLSIFIFSLKTIDEHGLKIQGYGMYLQKIMCRGSKILLKISKENTPYLFFITLLITSFQKIFIGVLFFTYPPTYTQSIRAQNQFLKDTSSFDRGSKFHKFKHYDL